MRTHRRSRERRRNRESLPLSPLRLAAHFLLLILAAGLGWLIVQATLVLSYSPRLPFAAYVAAGSPHIAFRMAEARYAAGGQPLPDHAFAAVGEAFAADALAAEPLFFAAQRRLAAGDAAGGLQLLEEARLRNPRHRSTRMLLIDRYIRAGRIADASAEIGVLSRLIPETGGQLANAVARLAMDAQLRPAIVRALAGDPLLNDVMAELVRQGASADVVLQIADVQRRAGSRHADGRAWQAMLLTRLVRDRDYQRARAFWAQLSGVENASPDRIYDGQFAGQPGGPPFNWQLTQSETGSAERARGGGLDVEYFGRASGPLARQLVLLPPGRYRLTFQADGGGGGQSSQLVWRVACDRAPSPLAEFPLRVETARRAFAFAFEVPAGCPAQWVSLEGLAAEFPTTQSLHVASVAIVPNAGGQ